MSDSVPTMAATGPAASAPTSSRDRGGRAHWEQALGLARIERGRRDRQASVTAMVPAATTVSHVSGIAMSVPSR
jgi:hypothetical protein